MSTATASRAPRSATPAATDPTVPLSSAEKILGKTVRNARERYCLLTPREAQVAELMADGKQNSRIAEELGISVKTLDIHRANVKHKLHAHTTAEVANTVNMVRLGEAAGVTD